MAAPANIGQHKTVKLTGGAATQTIEAAVAGQMIQVDAFVVSSATAGAGTADFQGTSGTSLTGPLAIAANGSIALSSTNPYFPLFWTAQGEGLQIVTTANISSGFVTYRIVKI